MSVQDYARKLGIGGQSAATAVVNNMERLAKFTKNDDLYHEAMKLREKYNTGVGDVRVMRFNKQWYQKVGGTWKPIKSLHDIDLEQTIEGEEDESSSDSS